LNLNINEQIRSLFRQHGRGLLGLLVLLLVVHDIFGTHGFLAMRRTQNDIEKVKKDLSRLNQDNSQLGEEVKSLKTDPHAVEKIARDELGLAKPGEIVIKIPQAQQLPETASAKP
jgi:cell division protein FtsB